VNPSDPDVLNLAGASVTGGIFNGNFLTGPVAPGATVYARVRVRVQQATAARIEVVRLRGRPSDPDATNDLTEVVIDGIGPAPGGGRWIASGNIDGAPGEEIVTGTAAGDRPQVRVFDGGGGDTGVRFWAFEPSFRGGVRVASCDVDGDGMDEIIAGQGAGGSSIRVVKVVGGTIVDVVAFDPFESTFLGGVFVACADLNGDGRGDIVVGAGPGRAADVRVFTVTDGSAVELAAWTAYEGGFAGGVRVAAAAFAGSSFVGPFNVITTPGPGIPVLARAWSVGAGSVALVGGAVTHAAWYTGGATATLGDVDGDGELDLGIAPDSGAPGLLRVLSLATGQAILDVPFGYAGITYGLRVDTGILTGGYRRPELLVTGGPGAPVHVWSFLITARGEIPRVTVMATEIP
jgi:hypothetical protein